MTGAEVVLSLCAGCGGADWSPLRRALAEAPLPVPVRLVSVACMNGCARPVTMALQAEGRATCLFGGVDPGGDVQDILSTVTAYATAPGGWIEDARACGRLRHCLTGRVPAQAALPARGSAGP